MSVSRILSKLPSGLASNTGKILSINAAGEFEFRNDVAGANTVYLQGALDQVNTNIISANTQLKSYTDGVIASSNTQLKSYVDGNISYVNNINNNQNTSITTATNLAQGAYDTANLKFNTSGGNITGPVTISSNLTITGNLTVSGNVTTVSANNLILKDNMIYLNDGNFVTNPDLGIAGNYNDGTYRHTGFFRDASDGYWKVYDQYLPEPDASPYIDTSNTSFRIADFQANNVTFGKITTSSSLVVSNLNADYLDGQHGSYYTGYTDSANTQLKSYADSAISSANTQLKSYVDGKSVYIGTTSVVFNRSSASQTLNGVSVDGNAGTVTNGVYTSGSYSDPSWLTLSASKVGLGSVANLTYPQYFNNGGNNHSTYTDFNSITDFGARYVQGSTNGPGTGSSQFYGFSLGLGNEYAFGSYALQLAIPRYTSTDKYISFRAREGGTWGSWVKISAGYADSAGGIATSTDLQVNSIGVNTAASGVAGQIRATNTITAYYSDKRLKDIKSTIPDALEKTLSLSGVLFTQNKKAEEFGYNNYEQQVGVIAQEVQAVLPEAVKPAPFDMDENNESKTGENYLTVQYDKLVPLLIEAIKEQQKQIERLEQLINAK